MNRRRFLLTSLKRRSSVMLKRPVTTHQLGWGLAIILLLASGCASTPPPKSLAAGDLKDIVGLWTGRFDSSGLARQHVFTIREDGTFQETATGAVDSSGSVQIRNGLAVF